MVQLIIILIVLAILAAALVIYQIGRMVERINSRLDRLEESQNEKHRSYRDIRTLEDFIAVSGDVEKYLKATEMRVATLTGIIRLARAGKYDPESPAGRRPEPET